MSIFSRAFNSLTNVLSSGVRMSASPRLLGRYSGGAGAGQEIQLGAGFSFVGDTLTLTSGAATWGAITGTLASQTDLQSALNAKAASSHTHVSADVTDALSDASGVGSNGKLLKVSQASLLASTVTVGAYIAKSTGVTTTWAHNRLESTGVGNIYAELPFGAAAGMLPVLRMYADSTAANAVVAVGDAWWDTTLNKARVRLT